MTFAMTQAFIDAEVAIYALAGGSPLHGFLHTYLGAALLGASSVALMTPLLPRVVRAWNAALAPTPLSRLRAEPRGSLFGVVSGALFGSASHVLLDSLIYRDIAPFAPLSDGNALLGALSTPDVNALCAALGAVGVLGLGWRMLRRG